MDITLLSSEEFDLLRAEWNDLLARSASDSVFLRWEWIHTWWDVFKQNKKLFILIAKRDGRVAGIAPFYIERTGPIGLRTLKLCSEELSPDYMDIIAEKGQETEVAGAVVRSLIQRTGEWDLITLDPLRADSCLLAVPSLFQGYVSASHVSYRCPYIKIEGTFDDYYRPRTPLHSFGFKKKLKVLFDQKNVTHQIVSNEELVPKALDDIFRLHEKRSRLKNILSNFLSSDVRRFHHQLSRLFLKERMLSMHLLSKDETPISALYAFNYKNKTFIYQIAFDPEWSKWSAGAALIYLCVQRAFEDGLKEFDWLKGMESYKSLWANAVHDEMTLTVYNKNLRGTIWLIGNTLKSALRPMKQIFFNRHADRQPAP